MPKQPVKARHVGGSRTVRVRGPRKPVSPEHKIKDEPNASGTELLVKSELNVPPTLDIKVENLDSPGALKTETGAGDIEDGPPGWFDIYSRVREMRARIPAPVDTMGCERIPDHAGKLDAQTWRLHLLVTLMLSSQTKDEVNAKAMANIREYLQPKGGLSVQNLIDMDVDVLDKLIHSVGFHSRKAQYIKSTAEILKERFDSDIPLEVNDMMSLPGVGPKMSYLLRSAAYGIHEGIGVDVHIHRLAQMWGWVPAVKSPSPEKTRLALQAWLPREYWHEINGLLVGFGQTVCPSRGPRCGDCSIAETGLCKVGKNHKR